MIKFSRRNFLRIAGCGAAASLLPVTGFGSSSKVKPDFRVAFLTDTHVDHRHNSAEGFLKCLNHAINPQSPADFIITGGDLVYDVLEKGIEDADSQHKIFFDVLNEIKIPVCHTLGNHECFGVYEDSGVKVDHPLYGKKYYLDKFGLEKTYYSFDYQNWHFVILDSIGIDGRNYKGWIDKEQLEWLDVDLATANKPTVISMHIPLFTNFNEWRSGIEKADHPKAVVGNCHEVVKVLEKYPVKLVLGGHLHINETYSFRGIEFANIGAVSGAWWKGPRAGFEEGYAMLEFKDNRVSWKYVDYGWEVPEEVKIEDG